MTPTETEAGKLLAVAKELCCMGVCMAEAQNSKFGPCCALKRHDFQARRIVDALALTPPTMGDDMERARVRSNCAASLEAGECTYPKCDCKTSLEISHFISSMKDAQMLRWASRLRNYFRTMSPDDLPEGVNELAQVRAQGAEWRPIEQWTEADGDVIVDFCGAVGEARFHDENGWWWAGNHPTDAHGGQIYPTVFQKLPTPFKGAAS